MKLGKLPATYDRKDLKFATYRDRSITLPAHPGTFGYGGLIPAANWGMLGNDRVGDCAWAGPAHETMLWTEAATGTPVGFTVAGVLSDYSAGTGYNPADPSTDRGSDVRNVLLYRQRTGIIDAQGARHKIAAFMALEPGNTEQVAEALYLFGVVGIGFEVPDYAMEEFSEGLWTVRPGGTIVGGHYVCLVDYPADDVFGVVSWGREIRVTGAFLRKYCDEAWAILSPEWITRAKQAAPNGFDFAALAADLQELAN